MSASDALRSIAGGHRPDGELLPPCRLEAAGAEFFSEEAIVHSFRNAPFAISDSAVVVESKDHLAIFDAETALIADVFGGNIGRLWRLGPGEPLAAELAIGVPFDTDLMQARGDLAMRREDHPGLAPEAAAAVEEVGRALARDWPASDSAPGYRTRSFLIRAFTSGNASVALFALHTLGSGAERTVGFSYAAALLDMNGGHAIRIVRDRAGEAGMNTRPWVPVVAR